MSNLSILIKPASGMCNLNCQYCFYYDVMDHRAVKNYGFMSMDTLEQTVIKAFGYATKQVTFAFQGGEPTLVGLPFYAKLIEFVELYNAKHIRVSYAIQTNGIDLNQQWAEFFKRNHFLVGLSMDGPKEIHDYHRTDALNEGTFMKVQKAAQLLTRNEVEFNILCVVTRNIAKHPIKVYQFFKKNNYRYIQFIPCLDPLGEAPGLKDYALTPENYGHFLCQLFDAWYIDFMKGTLISIRMFDNIIQMLLGYPPESCDMNGKCSVNIVIESDGSIYPCDFYVLDEWCLGNINKDDFYDFKKQNVANVFVESSLQKEPECLECAYYNICRTGCRRHKESYTSQKLGKNYYCSAYKVFYEYTIVRFEEITKMISIQNR